MTDKELRALVRQAAVTVAAAIFYAADEIASAQNEDASDPMPPEDAIMWAQGMWDRAGEDPET